MSPPAKEFWEIQITEEHSDPRSFLLEEGSLLLGASPDCEITSNAAGVAHRHAEFSVNAGVLHLRILDGAEPVHLNGAPVRGSVDVPCPATLQIGALSVFVTHSGAAAASPRNADSTLRIVHPASPRVPHFSDPEGLDVTGRIVYPLPDAAGSDLGHVLPTSPGLESQKTSANFSEESTMAFSMEAFEFEIANKLPARIDYEVKGEIARGGMGRIYSAEDAELNRLVALKVSTAGDRGRDSQFFREARVLATLAHPNIVPIHTLGVDPEGRPFYSMKLIQGRTLQWIIKRLAEDDRSIALVYTRKRLLDIFLKVCDAVSFAHSRGYLHRDLKPENIMVGEFGEVLVMDWGLAKMIRKTGPGSEPAAGVDAEPEALSYIEGTPQYMSPEQANGIYGGLDERSDIYSLGGVLYAILTCRPPVSGASVAEVLQKVRSGETTTMATPRRGGAAGEHPKFEPTVPEALRAVTLKALSRDKTTRYQSVSALVADIEAYQSGFATSAEDATLFRQVWLLVKRHRMASALLCVLAAATVFFTLRLVVSEKLAQDNAQRAVAEKHAARKALAQTQISVAEVSEQRFEAEEMETSLRKVDPEFRTQEWGYLNDVLNSGYKSFEAEAGCTWVDCVPHPARPGVMITLQSDNWLRTLDLNTGGSEDLFKLDGQIDFHSLAVSSDGSLVAVLNSLAPKAGISGARHQIAVWSLVTKQKVNALDETPLCEQSRLEFSPDGRKVMKASLKFKTPDGDLAMFDVQTGKKLWQRSCNALPYDAEFIPKSGLVHYASQTEILELRSDDGSPTSRPSLNFPGTSAMPVLLKAGHVFRHSGPNVFHYLQNSVHFQVKLPGKYVSRMNFEVSSRDGYVAVLSEVGDNSAALQIRELDYGGVVLTVPILIDGRTRARWRLAAHPDSGHYAVFRGNTMKVWNITRYLEKTRLETLWSNLTGTGFAFLNTPDEMLQVSPPGDTTQNLQPFTVAIRRIEDSRLEIKREVDQFIRPKTFGANFSSNRDGSIIAALALVEDESRRTVSRLTTYRVQSDGTIVQQPPQKNVAVGYMKISPDGEKILTAAGVLGTRSGEMIQKHQRSGAGDLNIENAGPWCWTDNAHVVEIALVSDPASSEPGADRSLVLWSTSHSAPLIAPVAAPNATTLSASSDGTTIAEGGKDGKVRLRDARTLEVREGKTFRVHDAPVTDVAWHPKLPFLATASEDRRVRIWNVETGRLVEEIGFFHRLPLRLDWSPDGRNLAALHGYARCFLKPASCQVDGK
jgi:serine/threonine protein kinase/WD40 repeat protein